MSSHREAPEISKDPVADNTDVYAFVSPDRPGTVTILANFIPLQTADGGPNFYEFGDDVRYEIHIVNRTDPPKEVVYEFRFRTAHDQRAHVLVQHRSHRIDRRPRALDPAAVLLGVAGWSSPGANGTARNWPRAWRARRATSVSAARPTTPHRFTAAAVHSLGHGRKVFAGQRAEGFHVDLGSIFDLGTLRPFQNLHLIPSADAVGRERVAVVQRAHDRAAGAVHGRDARRQGPGISIRRRR